MGAAQLDGQDDQQAFARFLRELKERYSPEVVYLFGSRARGEHLRGSDYDLLVVSSKFEGIPLTDRATSIHLMWPLRADLDCLCLTPAEFERARGMISIVHLIVEEGVAV
jgi:hypothetical protein